PILVHKNLALRIPTYVVWMLTVCLFAAIYIPTIELTKPMLRYRMVGSLAPRTCARLSLYVI
ncbi:hypothetical protein HHI36_005167, partial [Cryptolaemus montrouzieri]